MDYRTLRRSEMKRYEDVLARHEHTLMLKSGVLGVGIGYKVSSGVRNEIVSIVVVVQKKRARISAADRIPGSIERIPTDVIEKPPNVRYEVIGRLAPSNRNRRFEELCGGLPIRNANLSRNNNCCLGAVVFRRSDGAPLGLTVQHGIADSQVEQGTVEGKSVTWGPAKVKDPIMQPLSDDTRDQIGHLLDSNPNLDVALVQLNRSRPCRPKVAGITGELNEATTARLGMPVECSARFTQTRGIVVFRGKMFYPTRVTVGIMIDDGYKRTEGGDSGGLWIDRDTRQPIGVHTGSAARRSQGKIQAFAFATCISQVTEWGGFNFLPETEMVRDMRDSHSAFAPKPDAAAAGESGFFVFRTRPRQSVPITVEQYDHDFQRTSRHQESYYPLSPVAAHECQGNVHVVWRSTVGDQVQLATLDSKGRLKRPETIAVKTRFTPAIGSLNGVVALVTNDLLTQKIDVAVGQKLAGRNGATSSVFKEWRLPNSKSASAPAVVRFQGNEPKPHLVVAWLGHADRRIHLMRVWVQSQSVQYQALPTLSASYQATGDPALTVVDGKLYLAFTTASNKLTLLQSSSGKSWRTVPCTDERSRWSPTLFGYNGRVVCARQQSPG